MTEGVLGVIIVNYRSAADVRERLASGALEGSRVVVVDNASEPEAVSHLCSEHGATAILLDHNTGFAGGVNAGVIALGPVDEVLLLNPDVTLSATDIAHLRAARTETGADGVAPLLITPRGDVQAGVAGGPITLRSTIGYFLMLSHVLPWWRGVFLTRRQAAKGGRVTWLCAACMLVRGDVFKRFGPLPTDEIVYAEDVAWGTTASLAGADLRLVADVRVGHEVGASGGKGWSSALERLVRRRLPGIRGRVAVLAIRVGLMVRRALGREVG